MSKKEQLSVQKPKKGIITAIKSYLFGNGSGVSLDLSSPQQTFLQMLRGSYSFNNYGLEKIVEWGYKCNPLGYAVITKILLSQKNIKFMAYWKGEPYKSKKVEIDINKATFNLITTGTAIIWKRSIVGFSSIAEVIDTLKVEESIYDNVKTYNYYQYSSNKITKIPENDLIFIRIAEIPQYYGNMGLSPLLAGSLAIDSIMRSYEYNINLVHNKGVDGMITNDSNENIETIDQEIFDKELNNRLGGANKAGRIATSTFKLRYFNIGRSAKELMLWDGYKYAFRDLCNVLQVDSGLFNDEELNTYANRNEAIKGLYNECVIPITKLITDNQKLVDFLGYEIYADTSGIEVLQESQLTRADKANKFIDLVITVNTNYNNNVISKEAAIMLLNIEAGYTVEEAEKLIEKPINIAEQ